MLNFDATGFTIRIETGMNPIEDWLELHQELLTILRMLDTEKNAIPTPFRTLDLLAEMMPDWETAKRMISKSQATEDKKL